MRSILLNVLAVLVAVCLIALIGFFLYRQAEVREAQAAIVQEYFSLQEVPTPSIVSPFMVAQATERFEEAPLRVIVYVDFLCPDCEILHSQMKRLVREFEGKLNVACQFFPLDQQCNNVVDKNSHPGACELSYIAAHDPSKFRRIHDEIFEDFGAGRSEEWRRALAEKYGVEDALTDPATKDLVHRIINTGMEYEKTSDRWAHGIRSTPTMIINNRLVIGTFPYPQLRAIFQALADGEGQVPESPAKKFMENWIPR
jgi:protein-disulfide isomerase